MKKNIFLLLAVAGIWACSKEDWPDNSVPERDWFAPEEGAMDETSVLRREFYDRNGVYILFSDTLGVREKTTLSGKTVYEWQVLKREYNMTSGVEYYVDSFVYHPYDSYVTRLAAAEFLEKDILPELPQKLWPNAVLLLDRLEWLDNEYGTFLPAVDVVCQPEFQAIVFAFGDLAQATNSEKTSLKMVALQKIVSDKISIFTDEDLELFYSYSKDYYNVDFWTLPAGPVGDLGFLETYAGSWLITFNSKEYDLKAYVEEVFAFSEEEFRSTYAEYPIVIRKMEALVDVFHEYGIKIYMK